MADDFSDYVATKNAEDQARARGEVVPPVVESAPSDESVSEASGADQTPETTSKEPIEPRSESEPEPPPDVAAAEPERNPDGTFKKRSAKSEAKADDVPRIRELTAKWRQAERERDELAAKLASAAPAPTAAAPSSLDPSDPEPELEHFLDQPDPYAALAKAAGKWAVREAQRVSAMQAAPLRAAEASAEVDERIAAFAETHPDYAEKVAAIDDIQFPAEVLRAIADDEQAPAVAYHLASHPQEARRIAALRPLEGVKAVGQLLARLTPAQSGSGVPAVSTSKAKPLIKPVSVSSSAPDSSPPDPDQTDFDDWVRLQNAADRKRQREMRGA